MKKDTSAKALTEVSVSFIPVDDAVSALYSACGQTVNDLVGECAVNNDSRNYCDNDSRKHLRVVRIVWSYELG